MGNTWCANSNEEVDDRSRPGANYPDLPLLKTEIGISDLDPLDHRPQARTAIHCDRADLQSPVKEVWEKLGPPPVDHNLSNTYKGCPVLGPFKYEDGSIYYGQYFKGQRQGFGHEVMKDGSVYSGYWSYDFKCCTGRFILPSGECITGEIKKGKINGLAESITLDGLIRSGTWEDGKLNGIAVEFDKRANTQYRGQMRNGVKHGKGVLKFGDGSEYEGDFDNNKITGKGKKKWADNRVYEGDWVDGKMEGHGTFTWEDGKRYIGSYHQNKKHGTGELYYASGDVYKGEWVHGFQHGPGELTVVGKAPEKVEFRNGLRL
jgi:hypothetical protein